MALTTDKSIYLNGNSKDGEKILANFSANITANGIVSINENRLFEAESEIEEADFTAFRDLAKNVASEEAKNSD